MGSGPVLEGSAGAEVLEGSVPEASVDRPASQHLPQPANQHAEPPGPSHASAPPHPHLGKRRKQLVQSVNDRDVAELIRVAGEGLVGGPASHEHRAHADAERSRDVRVRGCHPPSPIRLPARPSTAGLR